MNIPGLARARYSVRRLALKFQRRAIVLLYHRVGESLIDPQLLDVSKECFEQHMDHLARSYSVISVRELAQALADGMDIPHQSVAVTFDDGYADNLANAKPILEKYRVPATVFVASGSLGQDCEFWWDELERILLYPSLLPSTLRLQIAGTERKWDLGGAAGYSQEECSLHNSWNVLSKETPTARHLVYRELCTLLRSLTEKERTKILGALRVWSGMEPSVRETHRCLRPVEVASLASGSLVDVGAHTVSHSVLSRLSLEEQRGEIHNSRDRLESLIGRPVTAFAYPYGTKSDYTRETAMLVREAGFSAACSNFPAVITRDEDVYQLPRFIVRDWGKNTFARALEVWFEGRREAGSS